MIVRGMVYELAKCEDNGAGCYECSTFRWASRIPRHLMQLPRCSVCHATSSLKRTEDGYICMFEHVYWLEDQPSY